MLFKTQISLLHQVDLAHKLTKVFVVFGGNSALIQAKILFDDHRLPALRFTTAILPRRATQCHLT